MRDSPRAVRERVKKKKKKKKDLCFVNAAEDC
jgi:hypothetical protein